MTSTLEQIIARGNRRNVPSKTWPECWEIDHNNRITCANKLKANAAFTELVQLGQEIGDN